MGTACILAGGALALSATGSADAAGITVTNHAIAGIEPSVSCLTASKCVAVGLAPKAHGDVVSLRNGAQEHLSVVKGTEQVFGVSCPSSAGCWAIGDNNSDTKAVLIKINSAGVPVKSYNVSEPAGTTLARIACMSMTSCLVDGVDIFISSDPIEIGIWNGSKVRLDRVSGPRGSSQTALGGISCWHADCVAVGDTSIGTKTDGLTLTFSHGKPGKLHTAANDFFYGVFCASAKTCYAAGFASEASGVVVTLSNGAAVHTLSTPTMDAFGVECTSVSSCVIAGEYQSDEGELLAVQNGAVSGSPVYDTLSGGFNGPQCLAKAGGGFVAIGENSRGGATESATG